MLKFTNNTNNLVTDLKSENLKTIMVNDFDEKSAADFRKTFTEIHNSWQPIIPIIIDSYGGSVYSLFTMVDTIRASEKPVLTYSTGKAMSCGSVLLTCGWDGYRYSSPTTDILIHEISGGAFGKNDEVQGGAKNMDWINEQLFRILDENCKRSSGYFKNIYTNEKHRVDWFMSVEEAKTHNIINHIGIPKIDFEINLKMTVN